MPHRFAFIAVPLLATLACAGAPELDTPEPLADRHAYVWSMAHDSTGSDGLLVLDMDTTSATYGQVIGERLLDTAGVMTHHIERRVHAGALVANA